MVKAATSPIITFSGADVLIISFGSRTVKLVTDEPVKVTHACGASSPLTWASSFICRFFSWPDFSVFNSHARMLFSTAAFGSEPATLTPAGTRTRTSTCCTGILEVLRTTRVKSAGWPILTTGGPTHSRLTAGSCRPVGLPGVTVDCGCSSTNSPGPATGASVLAVLAGVTASAGAGGVGGSRGPGGPAEGTGSAATGRFVGAGGPVGDGGGSGPGAAGSGAATGWTGPGGGADGAAGSVDGPTAPGSAGSGCGADASVTFPKVG